MGLYIWLSIATVVGMLAGIFSMAGKTDLAIVLYSSSISSIIVAAVFTIARRYQDKRG